MQRKVHIRTKIFFIVLVAIIPTIAITLFSSFGFRRSYIHEQKVFLENLCDGFVNEQQLIARNAEEMLVAISQTRSVLDADYKYLNVYLHDLLGIYPDYAVLLATNSDGTVVASGVNIIGYSLADRDYFHHAKETGEFCPGSYIVSRSTQIPAITFTLPVNDRKSVRLFLIATFSLSRYAQDLSLNRLSADTVLEIFDYNGVRLFSDYRDHAKRDTQNTSVGTSVSSDLYAWAAHDDSHEVDIVSIDGAPYFVAKGIYRRNDRDIYITVRKPVKNVLSESNKPATRIIVVMSIACILAFALSLQLARRLFVRRIEQLTVYTRELSSGNLGIRSGLNTTRDEITDLAEAFNNMAATLEKQSLTNKQIIEEKERLLQELKRRVSDNLQLLSSMVSLQIDHVADETVRYALMTTHSRIMALSLVYETIFRYSDVEKISMQRYCNGLCEFLLSLYTDIGSNVSCRVSGIDVSLPIDTALPLALVLNELISNSLLHAFPEGKNGSIEILFTLDSDSILKMNIIDTGIGIEGDIHKNETFGYEMIEELISQIHGTLSVYSSPGGTNIEIVFPIME